MHSSPVAPTDNGLLKRAAIVVAVALAIVLAVGVASRLVARQDLREATQVNSIPSVSVIRPGGMVDSPLILPGRLRAWSEAPVYARTDGYLKSWHVDIGMPVRAGQVLAEIDAPDLDQQLSAAEAALATADAQRGLSVSSASRGELLRLENAISQQNIDERRGELAARTAMRDEAQANVNRLRAMAGFKRIVAPFDGVVTSRATDVGALIHAGSPNAIPLFTVADTTKLRIYVSVPQQYASAALSGMKPHFTVPDQPGRVFQAQLARAAEAVDARSGSMLIQLVIDNHEGVLRPGSYARVTLDTLEKKAANLVRVPVSALLFRKEGPAVAVVDDAGSVKVNPVRISRDLGSELEIAEGLGANDWVVISPSDGIATGDRVHAVRPKNSTDVRS